MPKLELKSLRSHAQTVCDILLFALLAAGTAILQACGGSSNPAYITPTLNNPAPGVQMVAITIAPNNSLLGISETRQLYAVAVYNDGSQNILTSGVTWAVSSSASSPTPSSIAVTSGGVASGLQVGPGIVTAAVGPVVGALQINVGPTNFSTSTLAVLSVPYKSSVIDAAYVPQPTKVNGNYVVQEVNLDADQFSSALPVPVALLSSIPLPAGFEPNAVIAIPALSEVAVISYESTSVVMVDASNQSTDPASNTVLQTFAAPPAIAQSAPAAINGITCIVCAGLADPVNSVAGNPQIILSTSAGYYTLDVVVGTFTLIPFAPAPAVAHGFSLNPIAPCSTASSTVCPYLVAPGSLTGGVQILNLTTNAVTSADTGLGAPVSAVAFDALTGYGAALESATTAVLNANLYNEAFLDLSNPQTANVLPVVSGISGCGTPAPQDMLAMGVTAAVSASQTIANLITTQTFSASPASGSCLGITNFPPPASPLVTNPFYFYGPMPATPDGNAFLNSNDANSIATFNDAYSSSHPNYGLLFENSSLWLARVNYASASGAIANPLPLPGGVNLVGPPYLCAGLANGCLNTVVYLPTPATEVTTSVNTISFGSVAAGTPSPPLPVTVSNIGLDILDDQINVQAASGTNAADFALTYSCSLQLQPRSTCGITVTFTPSAPSGTVENATLTIADAGGVALAPGCDSFGTIGQTVCLSGTAQ
jgi:hypothetical protein